MSVSRRLLLGTAVAALSVGLFAVPVTSAVADPTPTLSVLPGATDLSTDEPLTLTVNDVPAGVANVIFAECNTTVDPGNYDLHDSYHPAPCRQFNQEPVSGGSATDDVTAWNGAVGQIYKSGLCGAAANGQCAIVALAASAYPDPTTLIASTPISFDPATATTFHANDTSALKNGQQVTVTVDNVPDGVHWVDAGICWLTPGPCMADQYNNAGEGYGQVTGHSAVVAFTAQPAKVHSVANQQDYYRYCDHATNGHCGITLAGYESKGTGSDPSSLSDPIGLLGSVPVTFADDWGVAGVKTISSVKKAAKGQKFTLTSFVTADNRPHGVSGIKVILWQLNIQSRSKEVIGDVKKADSTGHVVYHLRALGHSEQYWVRVECPETQDPFHPPPAGVDGYTQKVGAVTYSCLGPQNAVRVLSKS